MTTNRQSAIRSVAVIGGGPIGWAAAVTLAQALPRAQVTLIATPTNPAALADRLPAAWPFCADMLARLGLDDERMLAEGVATPRLAERFAGWRADGDAAIVASGDALSSPHGVAWHQWWSAAAGTGVSGAFYHHLPDAALAIAGRLPAPGARMGDRLVGDVVLRLDAALLVAMLARRGTAAGVRAHRDAVAGCERRGDGGIATVRFASGASLAADLIVDAGGGDGLLGGDGGWHDWVAMLPVDRLLLGHEPPRSPSQPPSPIDDYAAGTIGWQARWPLARGTLRGLGWASALAGEGRARRVFGSGGDTAGMAVLRPGRRVAPWMGNVLALGDAAAAMGPLGWAGFAVALAHLELALALLPGRDMAPPLVAEYNRRAGQRVDRMRDLLAAAYLVGDRPRTPFWQALRGRPLPEGLAATVTQFARNGRIPHAEEDSVSKATWAAHLIGWGLVPARRDAQTLGHDAGQLAAMMAAQARAVAALVDRSPPIARPAVGAGR